MVQLAPHRHRRLVVAHAMEQAEGVPLAARLPTRRRAVHLDRERPLAAVGHLDGVRPLRAARRLLPRSVPHPAPHLLDGRRDHAILPAQRTATGRDSSVPVFEMPMEQLVQYRGRNPRPDDFEAYWAAALAELDSVDPHVVLEPSSFTAANGF